MIWTRERYIAHCRHEFTGREMFCELFGPLNMLEEEWRVQGASEKEIAMTAFDWDYVLKFYAAGTCSVLSDIAPRILEDTPEYRLSIDRLGRHCKLCKRTASIPLPLDFPVKCPEDWERIRPWYQFCEERINTEELMHQRGLWEKGYLSIFFALGGFDELRELMGEEYACIAFYEEPEMIRDMLNTFADTAEKVIERVGAIVPIDNLSIHEDMAGKTGPLIGPRQVSEFLAPYYRRVWAAARAQGAQLFSQDSDGNTEAVMDAFIDCGVQCFYPCEPAAGMDLCQLRQKYGKRLYWKGGIDKHTLRSGREAIRRELEYTMAAPMLGGGTVFALDHRIPNGVNIEDYRYYVKLGRELLGLGPITGEGWQNMAF